MEKSSTLKNVSIVSSMTVVSRVFGYLRDATFVSFFGISEIGAAFLLAFSFPNLLRRLLGEGTLASAVIPVLSAQYVRYGKNSMFKLFSHVIWRLAIMLCCILALTYVAVAVADGAVADAKWSMALSFAAALLPYMIFVCLAAIVSAALNVLGKFFVSSINQVWMNISMILSLLIGGLCFRLEGLPLVHCLVVGVLVGGFVQLAMPLAAMFALGWRPSLGETENLKEGLADVWRLFLPGTFGASIEQLNVLVSRFIAYRFFAPAVTLLYVAVRLVELPTGIFALAIGTVFFPDMAKIASAKSKETMGAAFDSCLVALLWILLPSAIGLFMLRREILSVFFERGNFSSGNVASVVPIVAAYCCSMVFAGASTLLIRGFHALKDMKTPAFVGFAALATNATLALTFVGPFGVVGLAMAMGCAAVLQAICLAVLFRRKVNGASFAEKFKGCAPILYGCAAVALLAAGARFFVKSYLPCGKKVGDVVSVALAGALAPPAYLFLCRRLIRRAFSARKKTID
ncbi:MAG: murein biosynthesis integral membrane protein MurJ [Puniceicoccales bacterium]|jgi:putative peptidoglycan lipid II flippase|nr:murein biosynthesis integral membrane protein MurJ [Puniceicoccales bacterium]